MVARNTRRKSLLVFGLVMAGLLVVLGTLWLLLRHEPNFYRSAAPPDPPQDREHAALKRSAGSFMGALGNLGLRFKDGEDPSGEIPIQAEWVNSFLKQEFMAGGEEVGGLSRQGISDPRVSFDKDRILLGFRYRNFFMSTVITVEMRIWLVPTEINTFAIEILNRRAGALPFPTHALLEEISNTARKRKFEVNWYRHEGHPVALVRIQSNGPRPTAKFDRIDVEPGRMILNVVPNEPATGNQVQAAPPRPRSEGEPATGGDPLLPGFDAKILQQQASPTPE